MALREKAFRARATSNSGASSPNRKFSATSARFIVSVCVAMTTCVDIKDRGDAAA